MLGEPPLTHPSELRVVHAARYPGSIDEQGSQRGEDKADDEQHLFTLAV
jgi:hypothetical protein